VTHVHDRITVERLPCPNRLHDFRYLYQPINDPRWHCGGYGIHERQKSSLTEEEIKRRGWNYTGRKR
jgi:hypothetical protein